MILKKNKMSNDQTSKQKQKNPLLNLGINVAVPALLMLKGDKWFGFSPEKTLIIALIFPLVYGGYDLLINKKYNFISPKGIQISLIFL